MAQLAREKCLESRRWYQKHVQQNCSISNGSHIRPAGADSIGSKWCRYLLCIGSSTRRHIVLTCSSGPYLADLVFNCRVSANGKRKKDKINEMKRFASARRCTEVNIREKGRKNRRASSSSSRSTQVIGEGSSVAEGNSSSWLKSLRAYNSTNYHLTAPSVDA